MWLLATRNAFSQTSKIFFNLGRRSFSQLQSLNKAESLSRHRLLFANFNQQSKRLVPLHTFHAVRFQSTDSSAPLADPAGNVEAVTNLVNDVTKIGDLQLLGLGSSYTPVGMLQNTLEYFHIGFGLPWWGSIVAATFIARLLLIPFSIKNMQNAARLNNIKPELEGLTAKMNAAHKEGEKGNAMMYSLEIQDLLKRHKCNPLKGLIFPLVQAPIFLSFFLGIRKMTTVPVVSMKTGGLLWFPDLTIHDPYYLLPVLTSATFLLNVELGADGIPQQQQKQMRLTFRIMAAGMIPLTLYFPSGIFVYWLTSNLFSLAQFSILRQPAVRRLVGIPELMKHPVPSNQSAAGNQGSQGFWETARAQYHAQMEKVAAEERKLKELEKLLEDQKILEQKNRKE